MEIIECSKNQPLTLAEMWQRDLNVKPQPIEATALLTQCLSLVRPVGFSDANADAWLMTALGDVMNIPANILHDACRAARKTADHHSKILPAIFAYAEPVIAQRRKHIKTMSDYPAPAAISYDGWTPTQEELDSIKVDLTVVYD